MWLIALSISEIDAKNKSFSFRNITLIAAAHENDNKPVIWVEKSTCVVYIDNQGVMDVIVYSETRLVYVAKYLIFVEVARLDRLVKFKLI